MLITLNTTQFLTHLTLLMIFAGSAVRLLAHAKNSAILNTVTAATSATATRSRKPRRT